MMDGASELSGKVALITGAARRSGRETALRLAALGAAVVVNARQSRAEIEAVASEIAGAGGRAIAVLADVTSEADVDAMVAEATERFGGIDILINNAANRKRTPFGAISFAEWREITSIIIDGAFLCSQAVIPSMVERGGGVIINIGGVTGHAGAAERAHVVTGKAALVGLTKALATEFGPAGIRVNCLVPGRVGGERSVTSGTLPRSNLPKSLPLEREGTFADIAAVATALATAAGAYISGQTIHVNGGLYMA